MVKAANPPSTCCQRAAISGTAPNSSLKSNTTPAAFDPTARNAVAGAGDPWYTSGAHAWKGTNDILKNKPASTMTSPARKIGLPPIAFCTAAISLKFVVPAAPNTNAMPNTMNAEAVAPRMRYFTPASMLAVWSRRKLLSTTNVIVISSSAANNSTRSFAEAANNIPSSANKTSE